MRNDSWLLGSMRLILVGDVEAIECLVCGRLWRAPAELDQSNSTYLVQHAFSHEPKIFKSSNRSPQGDFL